MEDKFEEFGCEFKNESECEEELEDEGLDLEEAEYEHFNETKENKKITKDMTFAELIMQNRKAAEKLAERGLFCGGCPMAQFETIEDGAAAHGVDVDELLKELNDGK